MSKTGTEVATAAVTGLAGIAKGLKRTRRRSPAGGGAVEYLRMSKSGKWTSGKAKTPRGDDTAIFNIASLQAGYSCWTDYPASEKKKNKLVAEKMKLSVEGEINMDDLPDVGEWDWKFQQAISGTFIDDKKPFSYSTTSQGGLDALDVVLEAIDARIDDGEEVFLFPMVQFDHDTYDHDSWGETFVPIFEVVGWADMDGVPEDAVEEEAEPEPKKVTKKKAVKKPEPEPEPEEEEEEPEQDEEPEEEAEEEPEEAPVRRRRRG